MGALELTLIAAAALVGFTGTWSPCGFSMIETIGPTGHSGGRSTTLAACITFFAGCLVGGVATFAALAAIGALVHGADARLAYFLAAGLAIAAALGEARGARIAPQVRRQLPEHWRRLMPMALAAGLYGVLLGLGFTTFVLTFGVWALAGISFAVGQPLVGIAIGLAFGIGRAVPIVILAPIADRSSGARCVEAMAMRPGLYRGVRVGDASVLAIAAVALVATDPAVAQRGEQPRAADPYVAAGELVYQDVPGRHGWLKRPGAAPEPLLGRHPAIGGGYVATIRGGAIWLWERWDPGDPTPGEADAAASVPTKGANAVAVSERWLVYRITEDGSDRIVRRSLRATPDGVEVGDARVLHRVGGRGQLGLPDLDRNLLVYAVALPRVNRIVRNRLGASSRGAIAASRRAGLSNPSVLGRRVLYVRSTRRGHELRLKRIGASGPGRDGLLSRTHGKATLWSTALGPKRAYVTITSGTRRSRVPRIVSVGR